MTEKMKVEAGEPGGFSLEPPISAASVSELKKTQDDKDLMSTDQLLLVIKEEVPDLRNCSLDQESPHKKEKEDKLRGSLEEEQLDEKEEMDFIAVSVKSECDEEKPQLSDLDCIKIEENIDTEASPSTTVEPREAEPDGRSEPERNSDPNTDEKALDSSGTESIPTKKMTDLLL
ncbi:uncharacterized protein LOC114152388 isoform X3 [Xiphophorus couchianus]|uniref:uncharacterized protein LOC114152388 isoform X3 n=1 Tax=Xiphophorus couchianus TaxID=32473 RepID=UPI00101657CF|nr:uncharacterized protein LOC114152388 isoform X3 [Xiphophorus couchianus]